jgi:hypothetical protein
VSAASVLVHDVLTGPVRPATVVAGGPAATYLDVDGRLVAVVAPGGVQLPCAVVLAGGTSTLLASLRPRSRAGGRQNGGDLAVGEGAVHRDGRRVVSVGRWFDPRVRLGVDIDRAAVARFAALVWGSGGVDPLLPVDAAERLAGDLAVGDAAGAAARLLGRGTGLTPAGDDLVAGALAALRAVGSPAADDLGAAVRALAPVATSRLSAALLGAADAGAVVPEAAAVLRSLARAGRLDAATDRLVALGHTSGWHLAAGLLVGVSHAQHAAMTYLPSIAGGGS